MKTQIARITTMGLLNFIFIGLNMSALADKSSGETSYQELEFLYQKAEEVLLKDLGESNWQGECHIENTRDIISEHIIPDLSLSIYKYERAYNNVDLLKTDTSESYSYQISGREFTTMRLIRRSPVGLGETFLPNRARRLI